MLDGLPPEANLPVGVADVAAVMHMAFHYRSAGPRGGCFALLITLVLRSAMAAEPGAVADAAMNGDLVTMRSLLKQGADPTARGAFGTPALHWRVRVDDLASAKLLLKSGADPSELTERGVSPLALAVENGNAAMAQLLLVAGADPRETLPDGETLLMRAAQTGSLPVVKLLLDRGAAVDTREPAYQQTALMFAARAGYAEVVSLLLERGADVNAATKVGPTPAFIAPNSVPSVTSLVGIFCC